MSLPPLVFFSLTPEEDDEQSYSQSDDEDQCTWIEDSECQENLFQIIPLTPEEAIIDGDNHIHTYYQLFFQELGYLTEEPEPIDPNRDYDQEAKDLLNQRDNKARQKHVDLSKMPSLEYSSRSGLSSSSSSIHHENHLIIDIRSPHYMGSIHHHHPTTTTTAKENPYHYGATYDTKHHYHHRPSRLH